MVEEEAVVAPEEGASISPYVIDDKGVNSEFVVHIYFDDLESGDVAFPLLLVAKLDEKILVAVPHQAWHRTTSKRSMQVGALSKATVVEVLAAAADSKDVMEPEFFIKCWVGFLKPELINHLQPLEHYDDCDFTFGKVGDVILIPAPESVVAAANEHFAFFSAEERLHQGQEHRSGDLQDGDQGQAESGLADLQQRVGTMEATMQKLEEGMSQLLGERSQERQAQNQTGKAPRAVTRPPALRKPGQAPVTTSMPRVLPTLDQGVVQAALQAGVPAHSLAQMEKLISQNTGRRRLSSRTRMWF